MTEQRPPYGLVWARLAQHHSVRAKRWQLFVGIVGRRDYGRRIGVGTAWTAAGGGRRVSSRSAPPALRLQRLPQASPLLGLGAYVVEEEARQAPDGTIYTDTATRRDALRGLQ